MRSGWERGQRGREGTVGEHVHARMQDSCRLALHLEKWLYPLTGCIHLFTNCLLVLIGASSGSTLKKIEANTIIFDVSGETSELYSHQFVQQAKITRQKSREMNDKSRVMLGIVLKK